MEAVANLLVSLSQLAAFIIAGFAVVAFFVMAYAVVKIEEHLVAIRNKLEGREEKKC